MDYRIGMVLTGRVTGIQPYGAFVLLDDNTQGLIHISELKHGFISDVGDYLKVGQMVKVMIVDITHRYKKYWSNRHVEEGFKPIAERLDGWVEDALEDIKNGK